MGSSCERAIYVGTCHMVRGGEGEEFHAIGIVM